MYISNFDFTTKHGHDYKKGDRISDLKYFVLGHEDKIKFNKVPYEEEDYIPPTKHVIVEDNGMDPLTEAVVALSMVNVGMALSNDDQVNNQQPDQFNGFGGGDGGGGGAGGSYTPDPISNSPDNNFAQDNSINTDFSSSPDFSTSNTDF